MSAAFDFSLYQSALLIALAVLIDALWRWPPAYHPITLFNFLAMRMAQKVCPKTHANPLQHKISGTLGAIMLIVPLISVLAVLIAMAYYPVFFEAIVLVIALDFHAFRHSYQKVLKTIGQNKKILAREMVSALVARDCNSLTDIGIAKAAIESLLLRFYYLYCGVLFWFIAVGPVTALSYRLLLALCWQWNTRLTRFALFGKPVLSVARVMRFPPAVLGVLIMVIVTHPLNAINAYNKSVAPDLTSRFLALFGGGLGVQLGGPAIYNGIKRRQPRVGALKEVRYSDMLNAQRAVTLAMLLYSALAIVMSLVVTSATH